MYYNQKNNAASIQKFLCEMQTLNVYDELNESMDSSPEHNFEIFLKSIKDVKNVSKVARYNKKKHKNVNG